MSIIISRLLDLLPFSTKRRRQITAQGRSALPVFRHSWKILLSANARFWSLLLVSRRAMRGDTFLTMVHIRAQCTSMYVNTFAMLRQVREMSERKLAGLGKTFHDLLDRINEQIAVSQPVSSNELILPLTRVDASMSGVVGAKMAYLGDVRKHYKDLLRIPEGFVITSAAYHLFLDHQGLRDEINRRMQTLEIHDAADMFRLSSELQLLIINAPLPVQLEEAIREAYRDLEAAVAYRGVRVAVRSSAVGEDSEEYSFAGQYRTELNVSEDLLLLAYKEVLASKYSLTAMNYRLSRGLKDEELPMCVGCLAMVDTSASGLMHTRKATDPDSSSLFIHAVPGLAKALTDGYVSPDVWVLDREPNPHIQDTIIQHKKERFVCFLSEEGVTMLPNSAAQSEQPTLTDEQVLHLGGIGITLEEHFGRALDIEWSLSKAEEFALLQARPLKQVRGNAKPRASSADSVDSAQVLLHGGRMTSPGRASGKAFVVRNNNDLLLFPAGSVLVAGKPHPRWSALLPRAVAIVTEQGGGDFSHLAKIAREFGIPALFDVPGATSTLHSGLGVTVDADSLRITAASASAIQEAAGRQRISLRHTPVHDTLAAVMASIDPLAFINPLDPRLDQTNIRTLRDMAQTCLLLSYQNVLSLTHVRGFLRRLAVPHPANWWVLDLDDPRLEHAGPALDEHEPPSTLPSQHPLLEAVWHGIARADWPLFVNSERRHPLLRTLRRIRAAVRPITSPHPRVFILFENCVHLFLCLERALFIIQVHSGELDDENAVSLLWQWHGAKAPPHSWLGVLRDRLRQRGFAVDLASDGLLTWSSGLKREDLMARARFLGYMIGHVQLVHTPEDLPHEIELLTNGTP